MGIRLNSPEEIITFPLIDFIPDGPEDRPTPGPLLVYPYSSLKPEKVYSHSFIYSSTTFVGRKIDPLDLPELISGAATWSHFYNEEDKLSTDVPLRTIRLALR